MKRIFLSLFLLISAVSYAHLRVTSTRVEHMAHPNTIDVSSPRISWINLPSSPSVTGESQSAYQIQVATSKALLLKGKADAWDTKKCKSAASYLIPYAGKPLQSAQDYWYRIRVWDQKGKVSEWSEPSSWTMGLLNPAEWKGQWIGAPWEDNGAPQLRKTFSLKKSVRQAKMFICGLGYFELYMNGKRVGNDYLVPNFTNYTPRPALTKCGIAPETHFKAHRTLYLSYDVTQYLRGENNAVGVILGNGFYNCVYQWVCTFGKPCLLCQLQVTYTDGTSETIVSDTSWKVRKSAILKNGPYAGEFYDARLEDPSWAEVNDRSNDWRNAVKVAGPSCLLSGASAPMDKITETIEPKSIKQISKSRFEVDFGKEISGWIRVKNVVGKSGDTLNVKYICESPLGIHQYVFKDKNPVNYAPRFTWYVFSKAIISGVENLDKSQLQAEAVNTDVPLCASFSCDNDLFNNIVAIWQRSQLDNMHGCIASDCPHRERSPYTGDGQAACSMVMSNFDAAAFYQKWIRDIRDAQDTLTGYVPNGAPWQPGCGGGVAWGAAMNIMPLEYYMYYGDKKMLTDSYQAMKMQVDQMFQWLTPDSTMFQQKCNFGAKKPQRWLNLGDWSPAYELPSDELVHTFYLWICLENTARVSRILKFSADESKYQNLANRIKYHFHQKFYDPLTHSYGDFGSNIYALKMGVPDSVKELVKQSLRHEIMDKYKGHINTGFLAARYFFEVLAENGMIDVAYMALNKRDFPSFGYWIAQGATVTWEQWNGQNSRNHPMFGGGLTWLYKHLAGIQLDENAPGYKHFYVKPVLCDSIKNVSYSVDTPYGKVASTIQQKPSEVIYTVQVPVGSTATLITPQGRRYEFLQGIHKVTAKP